MIKILYIGGCFTYISTNKSLTRGFENNGCKVIRFNYKSHSETDVRRIILETVAKEQPNYVFFSKCGKLDSSIVTECNKNSKTIFWYMDSARVFRGELIKKVQLCNYTFCSSEQSCGVAKRFSRNVFFLQEGFDSTIDIPINLPYKHQISFIGSVRRGERESYFKKYKFHNYNRSFGSNHSVAVGESKINLNFNDSVGTSDRVYKILASKGFLLTQPWIEMEKDFTIDKDLAIFTDEKEYEEKTKYYLDNEKERLEIAENGYNTVQKFSRDNWAKKILEIVTKG